MNDHHTLWVFIKSILLASASAFAFAGAAAADVSMSGSASASYNTLAGFDSSVSLDASASAALNNGWTATVTIGIDVGGLSGGSYTPGSPIMGSCVTGIAADGTDTDTLPDLTSAPCVVGYTPGSFAAGANGITYGNITLTDGTSSLAFGSFDNGAAYGAVGGKLNDHQSAGFAEDAFSGFSGSTVLGGANLAVSTDGADVQVGATMALGGADVAFGYIVGGSFGLGVTTSAGGADISFQTVDGGAWGLGIGYTMGSIALGFNTGDAGTWDITADYSADPLSVGVTYDNAGAWTATLGYDMGAVSASATFADGAFDSASLSYSEGAMSATLSTDGVGVEIEGSYDMGNGAVVMAGMVDTGTYVGLEYDLGNGAGVTVSYSTGDIDSDDYAVGYAEGGTVGVSFDF